MAELKTKKNDASVIDFLNKVENRKRKEDSFVILKMMEEITGEKAVMWGSSLIGFGSYAYKYASGRAGNWFLTGFSPRKNALTLYIMSGFAEYDALLEKLGKFKTGKSCLYIKRLEDVDEGVLRQLIQQSADHMRSKSGNES